VTTSTESNPRRGSRAAGKVAAGIFLSRILGYLRDRAIAYYFGASDLADAFRAALRLPNVLQNLLGEGTLSASLIPVYAEFLEQGREEEAGRFAGAALGILTVVAATLALLGILLAPVLVSVFFGAWDPSKQAITVTLVRIMFPMTGILVVSAWALGILNSHRRFFVSYVAPAFWNVAMITAVVGGATLLALGPRRLVVALAWGALAGGFLQFAVQLPFVLPLLKGFRLSLGRGVAGVAEAVHNFWPVVAARGVVNLVGWIDIILAARLAGGAVAVLAYAQSIYMLPISLFGMSVAASELPELSRMRAEAVEDLAARVSSALRSTAYFVIPSAVVYFFLGDVVVGAIYQTGAFDAFDTLATWGVLAAFSLGIAATSSSRVLSSAFYALRDTRTPARIAYIRVSVATVTGFLMMFPLDRFAVGPRHLGATGLALGASLGAWLEYVLLRRALRARIGRYGAGVPMLTRIWLASAVTAAAGVGVQMLVPAGNPVVVGLETLLPAGVVYLAVTAALGVGIPLMRSRAR
jgi:putative peptidoglycan lipid II flippase